MRGWQRNVGTLVNHNQPVHFRCLFCLLNAQLIAERIACLSFSLFIMWYFICNPIPKSQAARRREAINIRKNRRHTLTHFACSCNPYAPMHLCLYMDCKSFLMLLRALLYAYQLVFKSHEIHIYIQVHKYICNMRLLADLKTASIQSASTYHMHHCLHLN